MFKSDVFFQNCLSDRRPQQPSWHEQNTFPSILSSHSTLNQNKGIRLPLIEVAEINWIDQKAKVKVLSVQLIWSNQKPAADWGEINQNKHEEMNGRDTGTSLCFLFFTSWTAPPPSPPLLPSCFQIYLPWCFSVLSSSLETTRQQTRLMSTTAS